jgi:hypothetical protein
LCLARLGGGLSLQRLGFELRWRQIAEAFVQPGVVEPAEVFHDGRLELRSRLPDAVGDQLGLEAVDEALGQRVVVGVADGSDRGQHAG